MPPEFRLPRSSVGTFLKVPSTTGLVEDIAEDPNQHQDQGGTLSNQISSEVGLSQNPQDREEFKWTVSERESFFNFCDE